MGYSIQALVAPLGVFPSSLPEDLEVIDLGENVQLIPLGTTVQERYEIPFLPLTDDGAMEIPSTLRSLWLQLGVDGDIAYIEAEIFGGQGTQAYVMIERSGCVSTPVVSADAINAALRFLGVKAKPGKDEFDSVGLDKHRDTDRWLAETRAS